MTRASVRLRLSVALSFAIAAAGSAGTSVPVAAGADCSVKNVTDATSFTDVQSAVAAASFGDKLEVRGVCLGPVVIDRSITIVGKVVGTTLPGIFGQESVRPVEVAAGRTVTIRNLAIGYGYDEFVGGGIVNHGTLTLTDVTVFENDARTGGGIFNAGTLVINGASRIQENRASLDGAGIFSEGPLTIGGTSAVADNRSAEIGGGIVHLGSPGRRPPLTIRDQAVVRGNEAWTGFGILVQGTSVVLRDRASVRGNRSNGGEGQAAIHLNGGRLTMLGSASVRGNTGGWVGGIMGIALDRPSIVTMKGSSVVRANVGMTGGIHMEDGSILMLGSSSVRDHTAPGVDSAVAVYRLHGATSLTMKERSRVIDNVVADGFGAVARLWCSGPKATLAGLSGRVIRNAPANVRTLCP